MPDLLLLSEQLADFASGLGTYARGIAAGLAARGHRVTVGVPDDQAVEGEGYRCVSLGFSRCGVTPFSRRRMAAGIGRCFAAVAPADLVHVLDARWTGLLPKNADSLPLLGTAHDSYALDWLEPKYPRRVYGDRLVRSAYFRWLRRFERRAYRRLSCLLANSEHVSRAVREGYGVPADRVTVVRLGLPERHPVPPRELEGSPSVLFVGGNYQRKGLSALLAAVARLRPEFPELRLHVAGGDAKADAFRAEARRQGVEGRTTFHGWVPNDAIRAMMAGADVFAMPSLVEAFGLVYLEAMSAGVPVVATSRGGAAECFEDGSEALLVPPDDPKALAQAIRRIVSEPGLHTRLVANGRAAAARLSFESTLDATEAAYRRTLASQSA